MINEALLTEYIDGTLDAGQRAAVEAEINASPSLRAEVDRMLLTDRALTAYGVTVMASTASFRSDVYDSVSSSIHAPATAGMSGGAVIGLAAGTSALVAGAIWFLTISQPTPELARPTQAPAIEVAVPQEQPLIEPSMPKATTAAQRKIRPSERPSVIATDASLKDAPPYSSKSPEQISLEAQLASQIGALQQRITSAERNGDNALVSSLARKAAIVAHKMGDRNLQLTMWDRAITAAELSGDNARADQYRWEREVSNTD